MKVVIITVDDPKEGSLNPESVIDSIEVREPKVFHSHFLLKTLQSVESMAWPNPLPQRDDLNISGALAGTDTFSFVGLLRRLKHRGLLRETKLPIQQYLPTSTEVKMKT